MSRFPNGYLRWRVSKAGVGEYIGAPITEDIHGLVREFNFALEAVAAAPEGMVPVPADQYFICDLVDRRHRTVTIFPSSISIDSR